MSCYLHRRVLGCHRKPGSLLPLQLALGRPAEVVFLSDETGHCDSRAGVKYRIRTPVNFALFSIHSASKVHEPLQSPCKPDSYSSHLVFYVKLSTTVVWQKRSSYRDTSRTCYTGLQCVFYLITMVGMGVLGRYKKRDNIKKRGVKSTRSNTALERQLFFSDASTRLLLLLHTISCSRRSRRPAPNRRPPLPDGCPAL
jgi:hypothetical protein